MSMIINSLIKRWVYILPLAALFLYFIGFSYKGETNTNVMVTSQSMSTSSGNTLKLLEANKEGPKPLFGEISYQFYLDEHGALRVTHEIKEIFDYFLSQAVDSDIKHAIAYLRLYINQHLDDPAKTEAQDLLTRYLAMKEALKRFSSELAHLKSDKSNLAAILAERNRIMQSHLGVIYYDAFYKGQNDYDDFMLQKMRVVSDDTLSGTDKIQAINSLQNNLALSTNQANRAAVTHLSIAEQTQTMLASGKSAQQVYDYHVKEVGVDAAERLRFLDAKRVEWKQRLVSYNEAKQGVLAVDYLDAEQQQEQIQLLRSRLFNEVEIKRVVAQERFGGL